MIPGTCEFGFLVTREDMDAFASLSNDTSLIHTDDEFARRHGFRERIVYGGLLLAKLSHCLGTHLPGPTGISMEWSIRYHAPLYIDEPAVFRAEVKHVSEAMRTIEIAYVVTRDGERIATGRAHSRVLGD